MADCWCLRSARGKGVCSPDSPVAKVDVTHPCLHDLHRAFAASALPLPSARARMHTPSSPSPPNSRMCGQAAGAAGVVLMASPDGDVEVMAPEGETEAAEFGGAANGAGATNGAASGASATHGAWHIARGRRVSSSADAAHAHFHAHARPGAGAGAVSAGEAEEPQPYIPGTMVSYYDGLDLLTLLAAAAARNTSGGVVVEFGTQQVSSVGDSWRGGMRSGGGGGASAAG